MKQIMNMLRLDKRLILREKIAMYIIFIPILMSFLILMVLTAVEDDNTQIVLSADVPHEIVERIASYADIETVSDVEALKKRVGGFDNIAGAYWDGNILQVLFQGNEGGEYESSIRTVVDGAMNTTLPHFTTKNLSTGRDFLTQMIIAVLLTTPVVIGGIVSGFSIVTEKETLLSRAYRISPLPTKRYFISKYIVSIVVGLINLICISLILGTWEKLHWILLGTLFAMPLFAASPILIGGIAKDKMGCISMIKVIMLIFLCLPIAAGLTPAAYQFVYWPFPMYWHFKMMDSILQGSFNPVYGVLTFVVSGVVLTLLVRALGKKLQKA